MNQTTLKPEIQIQARLTNRSGQNIITSIRGNRCQVGRHQIGIGGRLPVEMPGRLPRNPQATASNDASSSSGRP